MSAQPQDSPYPRFIRMDQLRLLWALILLLVVAVAVEGIYLSQAYGKLALLTQAHEYAAQGGGGAPAPLPGPGGAALPDTSATTGNTPSVVKQDLSLAGATTIFEQDQLDAVQAGRLPWLEAFFADNGLHSKGDQVRAVIVKYMMAVNKIRVMEQQGVNSGEQSEKLYSIERERLMRTLNELMNGEVARQLDEVLVDNNISTDKMKD